MARARSKAWSVSVARLVAAARPFLEEAPRSTGELKTMLQTVQPEVDPDAMAYAVRTYLPQVMVPPSGVWRSGAALYTTAAQWFGRPGLQAPSR